jgi:DNA polymerase I
MISQEIIEKFLQGADSEEHIVSLEYDYRDGRIHKIIQHPEHGKQIKTDSFVAFAWVGDLSKINFYNGDKSAQKAAMSQYGIYIKKLRTDGNERLENGMRHLVQSTKSYQALVQFFKNGGLDPWERKDERKRYSKNASDYITILTPVEQYLISKKKRLFKGYESYSDIHKFVFDIETTGLDPNQSSIFLLGMRDNRGYEEVVHASTPEEEKVIIIRFFKAIRERKPTIIGGYNSAAFDFPFIVRRAEILGLNMKDISVLIREGEYMKMREGILKLGGEIEDYQQFKMWGFNVVDISHSVRRAQAINSNIKKWALKYITKFIEKEKPNRIYIEGNKINKTYVENKNYYVNPKTGGYKEVTPEMTEKLAKVLNKYEVWNGERIVKQYLYDDLYETDVVDDSFNQATFLLAKLVPTTYERAATMGTATLWKLIMLAWSYENELAVPAKAPTKEITGGLSRLVRVGYSRNVVKFDFASLYPSIQLVYDVFPECDITGVMKSMLKYFRNTRIFYKREAERLKEENPALSEAYDRKQLPIKIFINAFFGSLSAPHVFPWGDMDKGEQITCTGRQSLRMMIMFFMQKSYRPLVMDTDGVNFEYDDDILAATYIGRGLNDLVKEGKEYTGVQAHVAEFNDTFMRGEMGLDIDYFAPATMNIARKNYAVLTTKGKVKLTGNSIKSKKIQDYIAEFLDNGIKMLLDGKGSEFVEYYYEYATKIFNQQIPLAKIANKSRIKMNVEDYRKHIKKTTKAGSLMSRQAHMELVMASDFKASLGDTIFYVNNGTRKSHGDVVKKKDGDLILNCYMLLETEITKNPDKTGEYNVPRYLAAFNKRIEPLLVCFHPDVRDTILVEDPEKRQFYTTTQCQLVSGFPFKPEDQDDLQEVMKLSESEVNFYVRTNISPYYLYLDDTIKLIDQEWVTYNTALVAGSAEVVAARNLENLEDMSETDILVNLYT